MIERFRSVIKKLRKQASGTPVQAFDSHCVPAASLTAHLAEPPGRKGTSFFVDAAGAATNHDDCLSGKVRFPRNGRGVAELTIAPASCL